MDAEPNRGLLSPTFMSEAKLLLLSGGAVSITTSFLGGHVWLYLNSEAYIPSSPEIVLERLHLKLHWW